MISDIPIEYEFLNESIRHINDTLTDTTTTHQIGPGSNGNKMILYISLKSKTGTLPPDPV